MIWISKEDKGEKEVYISSFSPFFFLTLSTKFKEDMLTLAFIASY